MDPMKRRKAMSRYIKVRAGDGNLFWILWPYLMILIPIAGIYSSFRSVVYYFVDLVVVLLLLETFLLKCPYCDQRFKRFLRQFPGKCPHCGSVLLDSVIENSGRP